MNSEERKEHDRLLQLIVEREETLRGFIRALTSGREHARNVMQKVAAVLWRKFDKLESDDSFAAGHSAAARFDALAAQRNQAQDRHNFSDKLLM